MPNFSDVSFCGTFRTYQQAVLDRADESLRDGHLHIVAAPGSGKTILGLELIRRLGRPALILSPTVTIRQQWCERFEDSFLSGRDAAAYLSCNLRQPALLTSVTYQALYAAHARTQSREEQDEQAEGTDEKATAPQDFSDFDLLAAVRAANIGVICLDEAHHLRREWQQALEAFLDALPKDIVTIALTATPPYDSTPVEWKHYLAVCGEIDDEIFTPELVAQHALCPHQDYIYFNYPTAEETALVRNYRGRVLTCLTELMEPGGALSRAFSEAPLLQANAPDPALLLDDADSWISLFCLARKAGLPVPQKPLRIVSSRGTLPLFSLDHAQAALQFLLNRPDLFPEQSVEPIRDALSSAGLMERKSVRLHLSDKINRTLLSSRGKLQSICQIARAEQQSMGADLRMLILTDYIKKDVLRAIGSDEDIHEIGAVPIFETLRRDLGDDAGLALLSGSLAIVPLSVAEELKALAAQLDAPFSAQPLPHAPFCTVQFGASTKSSVSVMTAAFSQGLFQILIGTKALLGEGWDAPCVNSLIMASFVGSFVSSNQMRGRAIRTCAEQPDKASNIWHLVTIEPPLALEKAPVRALFTSELEDDKSIPGEDFNLLCRRFECFMAPAYHENIIENGIERVDIIRPPFDRDGFARINSEMLALAADRASLRARWASSLGDGSSASPEVFEITETPPVKPPQSILFLNLLLEGALLLLGYALVHLLLNVSLSGSSLPLIAVNLLLTALVAFLFTIGAIRILKLSSPARTIEELSGCVLRTLQNSGQISPEACTLVRADPLGRYIQCALGSASTRDKVLFAQAMHDLLSPIDNPRYVLVREIGFGRFSIPLWLHSMPCPAVIGQRADRAALFARELGRPSLGFCLVSLRGAQGRSLLLRCRRLSYLNRNAVHIHGRRAALTKWD